MSQAILSQILNKLQFLEPVELQKLDRAVQEHLTNHEQTAKQITFHQALVDSGLVRQIKKISHQSKRRQLVQVQGKPISEIIIEEHC